MNFLHQLVMTVGWLFTALLVITVVITVVSGLFMVGVHIVESRRKPFSLNAEWESTKDFIDSIPTKGKNK